MRNIRRHINAYFKACDAANEGRDIAAKGWPKRPYTIEGLCAAIGCDVRALDSIAHNLDDAIAIDRARRRITAYVAEQTLNGALQGQPGIQYLRHHCGWAQLPEPPSGAYELSEEDKVWGG